MSYLSNLPTDHGLLQFGCHSYGDFTYCTNTLETITEANTWKQHLTPLKSNNQTIRFITEHNLALFWQRPGLYANHAFPLPLLDTANFDKQFGVRNRPPGNIRADCPPIRHRQRNLLAGKHIQNTEDGIILWAVNDYTDHKLLFQLEFELEQIDLLKRNELVHIKRRKDAKLLYLELPNEALQLKIMNETNEEATKLFVRTKRSLDLANFTNLSTSTIFNSSVSSFMQIPYMDDEIAVVDNAGLLFWGALENSHNLSRAKTREQLIEICPTDCPRILLALSEKEIREVDLRESNHTTGHLLFSNQQMDIIGMNGEGPLTDSVYTQLTARDRFCHINNLDLHLETYLLTTNRHHILFDHRMPGIALLTMDHAEMDGGDYCLTVPSFTDSETDARFFSLFSLTHIRKPALSHWSFAYHPKENFWSSLGPKYELGSPRSILNFMKSNSTRTNIDQSQLPIHTRAIHYQPLGLTMPTSTRALLFRQMEGGEIWYENVFFDSFTKLYQDEQQMEKNCMSNIKSAESTNSTFLDESLQKIYLFQQERIYSNENINDGIDKQNDQQWIPKFYIGIDQELLAKDEFNICSSPAFVNNTNMERAISLLPDPQQMDPFSGIPFSRQQSNQSVNSFSIASNEQFWSKQRHNQFEEEQMFSHLIQTGIWPKTTALFLEKIARRRNEQIDEFGGINLNNDNNEEGNSLVSGIDNVDEEEDEEQQLLLKLDEEMMYKMNSMLDD